MPDIIVGISGNVVRCSELLMASDHSEAIPPLGAHPNSKIKSFWRAQNSRCHDYRISALEQPWEECFLNAQGDFECNRRLPQLTANENRVTYWVSVKVIVRYIPYD